MRKLKRHLLGSNFVLAHSKFMGMNSHTWAPNQ
jgi:hypothetical protein